MVRAGERLENPVTGEVLIFHETAAETGDETVRVETSRLPFPPALMQRAALAVGAPLGRALGYPSRVERGRGQDRGRPHARRRG